MRSESRGDTQAPATAFLAEQIGQSPCVAPVDEDASTRTRWCCPLSSPCSRIGFSSTQPEVERGVAGEG